MCHISAGQIDEVRQEITMYWVQPRVLELEQVSILLNEELQLFVSLKYYVPANLLILYMYILRWY